MLITLEPWTPLINASGAGVETDVSRYEIKCKFAGRGSQLIKRRVMNFVDTE